MATLTILASTPIVEKNLGAVEDFLLGDGQVQQTRNGQQVTVTRFGARSIPWAGTPGQPDFVSMRDYVESVISTGGAIDDSNVTTYTTYSSSKTEAELAVLTAKTEAELAALTAKTEAELAELATNELATTVRKDSSTGAANLPSGNTAERPDTAELGSIRYNTDINEYEGYTDSGWESLAAGATGSNGDNVFLVTDKVMTNDYTVPENKRAVAFGDVELIGDLTIPNNSELLVLGGYKDGMVVVNDISKLSTVNTSVSTNVAVKSYHNGLEGGGGVFYYDSTKPRTEHNGGTVIAPTAVFPSDWNDQVQLAAWFDGSGLVGTGCWVRSYDGAVNVKWFGAKGDGVGDDTLSVQSTIDYSSITRTTSYIPSGKYLASNTLTAQGYFSLYGDHYNYISGDNTPDGERYGSTLLFNGSINEPVIYADMHNTSSFSLCNLSIRVNNTFNNVGVHLLGSGARVQGGTFDCCIENIAIIREGTINPQETNAVGIYFDATQTDSYEGRAFFASKVNNYYAFNLNTGLKIKTEDNTTGADNWVNSNTFSNIKMYQTFIGIELTGGTGGNAIFRNTFYSIFIQGGPGISGSFAPSQIVASGVVTDNVFLNTIVWDSPSDVFLSSTHWNTNTIIQSYGHFSSDVIAQGIGVFGGGNKVYGGATVQAKGIGAYNASTGQLSVYDVNDDNRRVNIGYDPSLECGYIQATKVNTVNEPLLLNPNGGAVNLFPFNGVTPLLQGAMVFEYVSDTKIGLKLKGSDSIVRSITFDLV